MKSEGDTRLKRSVEREAARMKRAERERDSLLALTGYLGSLALMFLIPVIAGAYLGSWLDEQATGYSTRWTVSLIVLGLVIGVVNVVLYIRERG
ncbi:MAG: ATP synthase [Betaproteobacteria bacterium SG8_39]|nr:MAG: ATP synthase [Betaproteobacteria bacterium SG8_39]